MRADRHTPRVLLKPNSNGKFACPEKACKHSGDRWTVGKAVLTHVRSCAAVKATGVLYCLTTSGTKAGKLSGDERQQRRRAPAARSSARKKAARTAYQAEPQGTDDELPLAHLARQRTEEHQLHLGDATSELPTASSNSKEESPTVPVTVSTRRSNQAAAQHDDVPLETLPEECQTCYLVLLARYVLDTCIEHHQHCDHA